MTLKFEIALFDVNTSFYTFIVKFVKIWIDIYIFIGAKDVALIFPSCYTRLDRVVARNTLNFVLVKNKN